jgi:hypothetical protein
MQVEGTPKAGENSLGWHGQLAWSICQVSDIIITLRNCSELGEPLLKGRSALNTINVY